MLKFLNPLNLIKGTAEAVTSTAKVFVGDKEKRDKYESDARMANYTQFSNEFGHAKTPWDSFVDGLNRLPRPIMTFGTIFLFWYCLAYPVEFAEGMQALQLMPQEGWWIMGTIIGFWFAGKIPKDFGKLKVNSEVIEIAKKIAESRASRIPQTWVDKVAARYAPEENKKGK